MSVAEHSQIVSLRAIRGVTVTGIEEVNENTYRIIWSDGTTSFVKP